MALSQHSHARNARAKHARPSRAARRLAVLAATGATLATSGVLTSAPAQAADGATVVTVASHYAGDPYLWGGTTPAGFDCSGYVQYVYRQVGISLPRTTNQQYAAMQHIRSDQTRPGDVLFLPDGSGNIYHEGIYGGGNSWWVAAHAGTVIMLQTVYTTNYLVGRPASVVAGSGITVPPPALVAKPLSAYRGWLMGLGWRHPAVAALQPVLGVRPADGGVRAADRGRPHRLPKGASPARDRRHRCRDLGGAARRTHRPGASGRGGEAAVGVPGLADAVGLGAPGSCRPAAGAGSAGRRAVRAADGRRAHRLPEGASPARDRGHRHRDLGRPRSLTRSVELLRSVPKRLYPTPAR